MQKKLPQDTNKAKFITRSARANVKPQKQLTHICVRNWVNSWFLTAVIWSYTSKLSYIVNYWFIHFWDLSCWRFSCEIQSYCFALFHLLRTHLHIGYSPSLLRFPSGCRWLTQSESEKETFLNKLHVKITTQTLNPSWTQSFMQQSSLGWVETLFSKY